MTRTMVPVGGASDVLAAAMAPTSPRQAAQRLRALAGQLDPRDAREATIEEGHSVVLTTTPSGAALALRWFAPDAPPRPQVMGAGVVLGAGPLRAVRAEKWRRRPRRDPLAGGRRHRLVARPAPRPPPADRSCSPARNWPPGQQLESFRAVPTLDGCVTEVAVRFNYRRETRRWRDIHVLRRRDGHVTEHLAYCTGHWDAATIARHEPEATIVRP